VCVFVFACDLTSIPSLSRVGPVRSTFQNTIRVCVLVNLGMCMCACVRARCLCLMCSRVCLEGVGAYVHIFTHISHVTGRYDHPLTQSSKCEHATVLALRIADLLVYCKDGKSKAFRVIFFSSPVHGRGQRHNTENTAQLLVLTW